MSRPLVLASGSAIRAQILSAVGLSYEIVRPDVDEAALKQEMHGREAAEIALALAEAKAKKADAPGALVIGADQILEFDGVHYDKPRDIADAARRLLAMSGKTHFLVNGSVVIEDGEIVYSNTDRVALTMRPHGQDEIEQYLQRAGPDVLASVGAYQVEGLGAGLFERIDGDYFTVLGLSLLPLLGFLRERGVRTW